MNVNDVVQFNHNHKWAGSLGIVTEVKDYAEEPTMIRYMVAVPIPKEGTAFIYVTNDEMAIEYVGKAILTPRNEEE